MYKRQRSARGRTRLTTVTSISCRSFYLYFFLAFRIWRFVHFEIQKRLSRRWHSRFSVDSAFSVRLYAVPPRGTPYILQVPGTQYPSAVHSNRALTQNLPVLRGAYAVINELSVKSPHKGWTSRSADGGESKFLIFLCYTAVRRSNRYPANEHHVGIVFVAGSRYLVTRKTAQLGGRISVTTFSKPRRAKATKRVVVHRPRGDLSTDESLWRFHPPSSLSRKSAWNFPRISSVGYPQIYTGGSYPLFLPYRGLL